MRFHSDYVQVPQELAQQPTDLLEYYLSTLLVIKFSARKANNVLDTSFGIEW